VDLGHFYAIFCSDKCVLAKVRQLPRGTRARLMCEKHPSGPLDVPDPALYSDTMVGAFSFG
jgi:hypothetical protein